MRKKLQQIWQQTKRNLQAGHYMLEEKRISLTPFISKSIRGTYKRTFSIWRWLLQFIFGMDYRPKMQHPTEICVINEDALEVAATLKKQGLKPALLNPANARQPGGGYKRGAQAMEEDLFRRSTLSVIDPANNKMPNFYPLIGKELLYTPGVMIFRHGKDASYNYMQEPFYVSVITSAAIDLNPRSKADRAYQGHKEAFESETRRRIYEQLAIAADEGHDALVLTAFGCGAFQNPPEVVAELYKSVLNTHFPSVFKKVVFAVIDDHNTRKKHNPQGNFGPFKEVFDKSPSNSNCRHNLAPKKDI